MNREQFIPHHINACRDDFNGNGIHGRYVLLPGSEGRAEKISERWKKVTVKKHPRNHNLYMGTLETKTGNIDMAVVSTGMGTPSADIIINELILLGARNLIRVGTAGSLQPDFVPAGAIVIPTGSVRDESASCRYLPVEVPAVPSLEFLLAAHSAGEQMLTEGMKAGVFNFGIVHSKDSLYAREMLVGPRKQENEAYMQQLKQGGVLASEMETSILFALGQIYSQENRKNGDLEVLTGAVLAIIGGDTPFGSKDVEAAAIDTSITFCMKTVEELNRFRTR